MTFTAHDVRHLRVCLWCGDLGDDRTMLHSSELYGDSHGRCWILKFGLNAFLDLPSSETDKITLEDIGKEAMMALLDRREA